MKKLEKFMNQKGFANIILVIVIVAVLVGAVGYFAFVKKSEPTQTSKVETTNWLSFNSVKDTGIKPNFSFKHPSNWIQKGSIDGGAASYISFYDRNTYSQKCDEAVNGVTTCHVTGRVASALVSGPSMSPAKIEYNSETKEAITIDGYQGTKITGFVKSGVELNTYIGKPGQKEMRIIVPNVNGIRFEFTMLIESKTDEATFNEILKTIVLSSTSIATLDKTANWKTYSNSGLNFSINYPDGFQLKEDNAISKCDTRNKSFVCFPPQEENATSKVFSGADGYFWVFIENNTKNLDATGLRDDYYKNDEYGYQYQDSFVKVAGVNSYKQGRYDLGVIEKYYIPKSGKVYRLEFEFNFDTPNQNLKESKINLISDVLSTFKFTN